MCVFWVNLVAFYLCLVNFSFQDSFTSVMCMCTFSLCQRGTEDAMLYLSREAHDGRVKSVLFLMPCHSTPYYSTLHYNLPMRFLDCTPSENKGTLDESDRFLMNPADFVGEVFGNLSSFSHIVLFESEERHVKLLLRNSFQEVKHC
jgi:phosphatidylinositol glycan class B